MSNDKAKDAERLPADTGIDDGETPPNKTLYVTMARYGLNMVVGEDMKRLLAFGRDCYRLGQAKDAERGASEQRSALTIDRPMTFGGCPFCGSQRCVAGECQRTPQAEQRQEAAALALYNAKDGDYTTVFARKSIQKGDSLYTTPPAPQALRDSAEKAHKLLGDAVRGDLTWHAAAECADELDAALRQGESK